MRDTPFPCRQLRGISPHAGGRHSSPHPTSLPLTTGGACVTPRVRHWECGWASRGWGGGLTRPGFGLWPFPVCSQGVGPALRQGEGRAGPSIPWSLSRSWVSELPSHPNLEGSSFSRRWVWGNTSTAVAARDVNGSLSFFFLLFFLKFCYCKILAVMMSRLLLSRAAEPALWGCPGSHQGSAPNTPC